MTHVFKFMNLTLLTPKVAVNAANISVSVIPLLNIRCTESSVELE